MENDTVYLIKPDGNLWKGPKLLMADLLKQGWREVHNPKRTYYPEYDKTHPSYKEKVNTMVEENDSNILEVEIV